MIIIQLPEAFYSLRRVFNKINPLNNIKLSIIIQTLQVKKWRFSED